jgi:four helix bundle protein
MGAAGFEDLLVWQRSMQVVLDVYRVSSSFPADERFGLTAQIRRAAVSVPSNIAEGHERHTTREYIRFVSMAEGSLAEMTTQLRIACDLGYCANPDVQPLLGEMTEIRRMLNALRRSLAARQKREA